MLPPFLSGMPGGMGQPPAMPGRAAGNGRLVAAGVAPGPPFAPPPGAPTLAPPGFPGLPPLRYGPGGLPLPPPMPGGLPGQAPLIQVPPQFALARLRAGGIGMAPGTPLGAGTGLMPIAPVLPPGPPPPGSYGGR